MRVQQYLFGELDESEKQAFDEWLAGDAEALNLFRRQVRQCYWIRWEDRWGKIDEGVARVRVFKRLRRRRIRVRLCYAAVLAILFLVGGMWWERSGVSRKLLREDSVCPGESVPVLTLENGEKIRICPGKREVLRAGQEVLIEVTDSGQLTYMPKTGKFPGRESYNTLVVPRRCVCRLVLADGSRVWLNAGSSITYPVFFKGEKRVVVFSGEGYFEVAPDARSPFMVKTGEMVLRVLGTSFNVRAYPDEREVTTTLVTGKVVQSYKGVARCVELIPGWQSIYHRESGSLETGEVDVREMLAWKEGKIIENDARLEDIFRRLSYWYDFEVEYADPALKEMKFNLHVGKCAGVDTILEYLQMTNGVRFSKKGKVIHVSSIK